MKKLLATLLLMFLPGLAWAAAPTLAGGIVVTPATTGTAPFCVLFDASAAADTDEGAKAFIHLYHRWNFGDPSAGTWTTGANTNLSKNYARGPIASHCYETAGTYTVSSLISDGTTTIKPTPVTINVVAQNTTWSQANTKCYYPTGGSESGDCPNAGTEEEQGAFDTALTACLSGSTKRCLFQKDGAFTATATTNAGALTEILVGAYGTGAVPTVTETSGVALIAFNSTATNWKLIGIHHIGPGSDTAGGSPCLFFTDGGTNTDITVKDWKCTGQGAGGFQGQNQASMVTNGFFIDSTVTDYWDGNGVFLYLTDSAILGGTYGNIGGGGAEHAVRIQQVVRSVISHINIEVYAAGKVGISVRANDWSDSSDDSQLFVVSDNKVDSGGGVYGLQAGPSSNALHHRIYDGIFARNILTGTGGKSGGLAHISASRIAVLSNILDATGMNTRVGVGVYNTNFDEAFPDPDDNEIIGNTFYTLDTATFNPISLGTGNVVVTDTWVKNNLSYAPNDATPDTLLIGGANVTGTLTDEAAGGNSTDVQMGATDPFATTPSNDDLTTYRPSTAAYADTGTGIASGNAAADLDDFFGCRNNDGGYRVGAMAARTLAQCKGSAGP